MKCGHIFFFVMTLPAITMPPPLPSLSKQEYDYHMYSLAYYNHLEQHHDQAKKYFDQLLQNKNVSPFVYEGYIYYLFNTQQYAAIIALEKYIKNNFKHSIAMQLLFSKSLENEGQHAKAEQTVLELYTIFKDNYEVAYNAAIVHIKQHQPIKALTLIKEFLENNAPDLNHFIFYFLNAQLYLGLNKAQEAKINIKKSLELNPLFEQGWLLSGLINELMGNIDVAMQEYESCLKIVGPSPLIEQQLATLSVKPSKIDQSFDRILHIYHEKQYANALPLVNEYLQNNPSHERAWLLKIEILCAIAKAQDAFSIIASKITETPTKELWYNVAFWMYQAHIMQNDIIRLLNEIVQKNPTQIEPLLYLADIALKEKNYKDAIKYLNKIINMVPRIPYHDKAWYQLTKIYYLNRDFNTTKQLITQGIEKKIEFAPFLNLAAFFYATKGNDLTKANELIKKVLEKNVKNPHYLDTQAFIWYKEKKYEEAIKLFTTLKSENPHDFFICKHFAKTVFKQGKKSLAIESLKYALTLPKNPYEDTKSKKLLAEWHAHNHEKK